MSSFILIPLVIACAFAGAAGGITAHAASEEMIIYNWEGYIYPDLVDEFADYYQNKYGVALEVEYNTFETNEEMITKVLLGDMPMDVFCPSEYAIEKLLKNQALKKIDFSRVPNAENLEAGIMENIHEIFGDIEAGDEIYNMKDFMVPYMWGTLGILYNEDAVTEEDLQMGWGLLWNKADNPKLNKKILVKDSIRDTYVAAVLYAKEEGRLPEAYDALSVQELINTVDDELLSIVEDVLVEQQKVLKGYEVDFGKDDMVKESAYIDLAWSGDALWAIECGYEEGISLNYMVPEIGSNIWFDGWVIPKKVRNERAALEFINYMCRPESAILNMMEICYTSAVAKDVLLNNDFVVEVLLENEYVYEETLEEDLEAFFSDEIRYPELSEKLGVMRDFGDKSEAAIMMWENIKPGSTVPLVIILSVLVGLIGMAVIAYILINKFRGIRRIKQ